jgi:hypothetical protein
MSFLAWAQKSILLVFHLDNEEPRCRIACIMTIALPAAPSRPSDRACRTPTRELLNLIAAIDEAGASLKSLGG